MCCSKDVCFCLQCVMCVFSVSVCHFYSLWSLNLIFYCKYHIEGQTPLQLKTRFNFFVRLCIVFFAVCVLYCVVFCLPLPCSPLHKHPTHPQAQGPFESALIVQVTFASSQQLQTWPWGRSMLPWWSWNITDRVKPRNCRCSERNRYNQTTNTRKNTITKHELKHLHQTQTLLPNTQYEQMHHHQRKRQYR